VSVSLLKVASGRYPFMLARIYRFAECPRCRLLAYATASDVSLGSVSTRIGDDSGTELRMFLRLPLSIVSFREQQKKQTGCVL